MRLLELVHGGNEALQLVFDSQRERLKQRFGLRTITTSGMTQDAAKSLVLKQLADFQPTGILLRGVQGIPAVMLTGTRLPIILDHCTPAELGHTTPLREHLFKVRRALAYSQKAENDLRHAGLGRVHTTPGPFLPDLNCPLPENTTVAVLDSSPSARQVLDSVRAMKVSKGWKIDIVSPMVAPGVRRVANAVEAAEAAHLILGIYDEADFGQPHEAAVLALGFRRALATSRSDAFSLLPYPDKSFISAPAFSVGSYAAAVDVFLRNPTPFLEWPHKVKIDANEIPDLIAKWVIA